MKKAEFLAIALVPVVTARGFGSRQTRLYVRRMIESANFGVNAANNNTITAIPSR